jgi:hypothetical protein
LAAGAQPDADPAVGVAERELDALFAVKPVPETGTPGKMADRAAVLQQDGNLEPLVRLRRVGRNEGAGQLGAGGDPAHDIDQGLAGLEDVGAAAGHVAGRQGRADAGAEDPDIGLEGEVDVDAPFREIAGKADLGGVGDRKGAEVAAGRPHPYPAWRGGRLFQIEIEGARSLAQVDHLEPGAGSLGPEEQLLAFLRGPPAGEETVAARGRRPGDLALLDEGVRSVLAVHEEPRGAGILAATGG